jgi:hypothetical protein
MKKLIEAFTIFDKYNTCRYPLWGGECNKTIHVLVDPAVVSPEDLKTLEELGWTPNSEDGEEVPCFEIYLFRADLSRARSDTASAATSASTARPGMRAGSQRTLPRLGI